MKKIVSMDDSIFFKTQEQLIQEYKEKYGEEPELTDEEKRKLGLIK